MACVSRNYYKDPLFFLDPCIMTFEILIHLCAVLCCIVSVCCAVLCCAVLYLCRIRLKSVQMCMDLWERL